MFKLKKILFILGILIIAFWLYPENDSSNLDLPALQNSLEAHMESNLETHPLVASAREQIGVVTSYDTGYYSGGYPPEDRGACTDVIERALRDNGYDLKVRIDADMTQHPERYSSDNDPNINYRRVRNVKIFLNHHANSLPTCDDLNCIESTDWQPGDIVTFDQIPGSLWHIAIVSDKKNGDGVPLLIHNYARGTVEDDLLLRWPAPMTGRYRIEEFSGDGS